MERVITYSLGENFIEKLATFLCDNFLKGDNDLVRVACVFGGQRPALFLRRALAKKIKKPFYPPTIFNIDEFIVYLISKDSNFKKASSLQNSYLIYNLTKKYASSLLEGRQGFADFLPWAEEIASFIEQLDLEDIPDRRLSHIEKSAEIGYDVPSSINNLLKNIIKIRQAYHQTLDKGNIYSRGHMYLQASRLIAERNLDEFEAIIFCNFFYLHTTELRIIKEVYCKGKGICIFQGSSNDWSVLRKNAQKLNISIETQASYTPNYNLYLYQGFDLHSQVSLVRQILSKIKNKADTVIVLPRPEALIPLLTEIASLITEFNVSLGYPLKRSALYILFNALRKTQESRKSDKYYARDYLGLLRHPLIKNLEIFGPSSVTRIMVHKIEELLSGEEESSIGGSLFLSLSEIENEEKIYSLTCETLQNIDITANRDDCRYLLRELHNLLFRKWEQNKNFREFADSLENLLTTLTEKSAFLYFPFNIKAIGKLEDIKDEFKNLPFADEEFYPQEIWQIFQQKLEAEAVSFIGSPLRGIQILGLFETRSLNFENVIIMDVNESVLPKLKIYEPLIPREVMLNLGLNRLEKEEEIQRYHFNSLIAGAKNVYLVYEESQEKERSRFIEELLWQKQKESKTLDVTTIPRAAFAINVISQEPRIRKTSQMIEFLKKEIYSSSRVNTYLRCPLAFYYQYVLGLKEKEDLLDEPQASHIGTFIHQLLEETFRRFCGKKPLINDSFKKYFFKTMEEKFEREISPRMKSDSLLLKKIIKNRLMRFLDNEIERGVARIISLEKECLGAIELNKESIQFKYTVDRIDELKDSSIMVIDYKTGGADLSPKGLSALEAMEVTRQAINTTIKSFQLPLYYYFVSKEFWGLKVNAQLYNLRTLERRDFISESDYPQRQRIMEICLKSLEFIFSELFNLQVDFVADREERKCSFCNLKGLCR